MAIQTIPSTLIADNAISAAKIAAGVISADDISNNSITAAKISASTSPTFAALTTTGTINGLTLAAGSVATSTSQNFALNTPNSLRINIDSNDNATDQVFAIGHNRTDVGVTNDVLMMMNETGNMAIGHGTPSHRLHIQGDSNDNARVRVTNTGSGQASLDLSNTEGYFRTFTDAGEYRIYDQTDGAYRMIIDTSGNVGIGTSSPQNPLEIQTTNKLGATFTGGTDGEGIRITQTDYTANNHISLIEASYDDSSSTPDVRIGSMFNGSGSWLKFGTSNNYGTGITNTAVTIDPSGNVGIGTTGPESLLHIDGSYDGPLVTIHQTGGASSNYRGLDVETSSTGTSVQRWFNSGTELMRVTGTGNVGIGTNGNPQSSSYRLEVKGGSIAWNLGTGNLGNYYFILNAGTNNDGGFILKRDNSNQYQIVNNASGNLTIYQYANSKEIFNIDTAGTTNFYGDAIKLPTGGTSDRPSTAVAGMMRYNTDLDIVEIYDSVSTEWRALQVGEHAEAPRFINPTTYHVDHFKIIGPTGQRADADFSSGYGAVTLNCSFVGNFTVLSKWAHDYMGIGIAYKDNFYNSAFTGESTDGNGPYGGSAGVDGFDSSVSYMGQYHWPVSGGGSDDHNTTWYIKHQRSSNTISTHYSTNSAAEFDKNHSSWTQVQSATVSSNNECKPLWGEAAGSENVKLQLNYVEGEYHTKNYAGNQEIVN